MNRLVPVTRDDTLPHWWADDDKKHSTALQRLLFERDERGRPWPKLQPAAIQRTLELALAEFRHSASERCVPHARSKDWLPLDVSRHESIMEGTRGFTLVAVRKRPSDRNDQQVYGVGFLWVGESGWSLRPVMVAEARKLRVVRVRLSEGLDPEETMNDGCGTAARSRAGYNSWPDEYAVIDYVGDLVVAVSACLGGGNSDVYRAFGNPTQRAAHDWALELPEGVRERLNPYQLDAAAGLGSALECVRGPPGTGKSTLITAVAASASARVCIMAVQNRAIDSIVTKLAREGVEFFVAGNAGRLEETCKHWTVKAQVERDPEACHYKRCAADVRRAIEALEMEHRSVIRRTFPFLLARQRERREAIVDALIKQGAQLKENEGGYKPPCNGDRPDRCEDAFRMHKRERDGWKLLVTKYCDQSMLGARAVRMLDRWKCRLAAMEAARRVARSEELRFGYRAVVCTCSGLEPYVLRNLEGACTDNKEMIAPFELAVVDEAGAASDIHLVMVVTRPSIQALLLVGDEKQLPPFVKNQEVRSESTFERFARDLPVPQLNLQYRMPEALSNVLSAEYYGGALLSCDAKRGMNGVRFIPSNGAPIKPERGNGILNPLEAEQAVAEAQRMLREEGVAHVTILTFYKQQKHRIDDGVKARGDGRIEVLTVDSAQGNEYPGVVLSCVAHGRRPGFVTNPNRLCVALSRAQERLTVIAHDSLVARIGILQRLRLEAETRRLTDVTLDD